MDRIPQEIIDIIGESLSPPDILSWELTSKRHHDRLMETLYRAASISDEKERGWPRHLVHTAVKKQNMAFKRILQRTPLEFINQPNVNARMIPNATAFDSKYWPLSIMILWQNDALRGPPAHILHTIPERHDRIDPLIDEVNAHLHLSHPLQTSLFHIVCQPCDLELVEAALAKGLSNSVYDAQGYSPLYLAVQTRNSAAAKMLFKAGSVPSTSDGPCGKLILPDGEALRKYERKRKYHIKARTMTNQKLLRKQKLSPWSQACLDVSLCINFHQLAFEDREYRCHTC